MLSETTKAAQRILKTIDGVFCGMQVAPGQIVLSKDVIDVCDDLLAIRAALKAEAQLLDLKAAKYRESLRHFENASDAHFKVAEIQEQLAARIRKLLEDR